MLFKSLIVLISTVYGSAHPHTDPHMRLVRRSLGLDGQDIAIDRALMKRNLVSSMVNNFYFIKSFHTNQKCFIKTVFSGSIAMQRAWYHSYYMSAQLFKLVLLLELVFFDQQVATISERYHHDNTTYRCVRASIRIITIEPCWFQVCLLKDRPKVKNHKKTVLIILPRNIDITAEMSNERVALRKAKIIYNAVDRSTLKMSL